MTRLVLHIDRLVLTGIDRHDADAVAAGVQAELQRLLAQPGALGTLTGGGDRARIGAGRVAVAHGGNGYATGQAIAGGIARGVKP
ncbi:hypothetical protein [Denitromonas ohlonensis]|uniref:Uncharacterized protein n=2 Tax=Denitromonas TaxID=139331 RepID=A0A557S3I7_9RHOO|nr:hypothetical protein [Denitromonas ohlonensis]TVT51267.1 MAG: hypothetical protein FHP94_02900 [Denitromonas halophila]TVO67363.1 hypothetical protein FHP90_07055 [Denitromonas ohlonensis]TVO71982.1 hypothetical protein FHP89_19190 [Denitromonas ohlonensis]TVT72103.1 MAG: hypothetical protein FHP92_15325 [Denitromonas halophila]TVT74357.1 MAG: hypothetical protein FHP93_04540 [Denitromonas halophila]